MISFTALAAYEKAIHERFPSVTVIPETRLADEYDDSICALGVPAEKQYEFLDYIADEIAPAFEARGIDLVAVTPYSWTEAEKLYPEACDSVLVLT